MRYCHQVETGEVDQSVTENRSAPSLIDLDRDPKGFPLVQKGWESGTLINMKNIIRSFITTHYRNDNFLYSLHNSAVLIYYQVLHLAGNTIGSHGNRSKSIPALSSDPNTSQNQQTVLPNWKIHRT
jgi:hypothetical protein